MEHRHFYKFEGRYHGWMHFVCRCGEIWSKQAVAFWKTAS